MMWVDGNGGGEPNYHPNSFDDIYIDESYKETPMILESNVADAGKGALIGVVLTVRRSAGKLSQI